MSEKIPIFVSVNKILFDMDELLKRLKQMESKVDELNLKLDKVLAKYRK